MHPNVHCSTVYNSQDMEAASMSIDRGMDKENVVHIYNGLLLSHEKNEMRPLTAMWTHLESVMLSEVYQIEKETYMTSLICESKRK